MVKGGGFLPPLAPAVTVGRVFRESMQTIFDTDRKRLMAQAAAILAAEVRRFFNKPMLVGLPGGRAVIELFGPLSDLVSQMPSGALRQFHLFLVDERCVPASSLDSNAKLLDEALIAPFVQAGILTAGQFHKFNYREDQPDWGVGQYCKEFADQGGEFDLAVLSVGEDGHIASLFPGHPAWGGTESTAQYICIDNSPKLPLRRITATPAVLKSSGTSILLFLGQEKRNALAAFRRGDLERSCPARIVAGAPRLFVVTDIEER